MTDSGRGSVQRWIAGPASEISWSCWDDGCALYHRPSGQTHFVNEATLGLLLEVLTVPRTLVDASQELARVLDQPFDRRQEGDFARLVLRLEELGLLQRVGP